MNYLTQLACWLEPVRLEPVTLEREARKNVTLERVARTCGETKLPDERDYASLYLRDYASTDHSTSTNALTWLYIPHTTCPHKDTPFDPDRRDGRRLGGGTEGKEHQNRYNETRLALRRNETNGLTSRMGGSSFTPTGWEKKLLAGRRNDRTGLTCFSRPCDLPD